MPFRIFTVLAVLALAISTWILSSPAHRPGEVGAAGQSELPGYYLKNAVVTDFDVNGVPSIRLEAERMNQVADGTEVQLSTVRVRYQSPNGQNWVLVGDTAHVEPGGNVIDVSGNVTVRGERTERAGSAVISTDALSYDVPASVVSTKSDVRVDFGAHSLTARGLVANLKDRSIHLENKVNGRFVR